MLAEGLPVRARVCFSLLAADIALQHLAGSPDIHLARKTLTFALNWQNDMRGDLDKWDHMLEDEKTGLAWAEVRARARSKEESLAWCVFTYPIYYAAYHAFRAANRSLSGMFDNVDEDVFDYLDADLRRLAPSAIALMCRGAEYLRQHPEVSFAQLKLKMSRA